MLYKLMSGLPVGHLILNATDRPRRITHFSNLEPLTKIATTVQSYL